MADNKDTTEKGVLKLSGSTLKLDPAKAADGVVRQSFSHGRSKSVAVEVKKKRVIGDTTGKPGAAGAGRAGGSPTLTEQEREQRAKALKLLQENAAQNQKSSEPSIAELNRQAMAQQQAEEQKTAVEQATVTTATAPATSSPSPAAAAPAGKVVDRDALRKQEMEEMRRIKEQERQAATQAELKRQQEENARRRAAATPSSTSPADTDRRQMGERAGEAAVSKFADRLMPTVGRDDDDRNRNSRGAARRPGAGRGGDDRGPGRLNVQNAMNDEDGVRRRSMAAMRRRAERGRRQFEQEPKEKIIREVILPEVITVQELANRMSERGADVIKCLMKMGMMTTINQTIDADTAELVITEFGHKLKRVTEADVLEGLEGANDDAGSLITRAPVVTIMGHVDHGKTSLLDAIRSTQVAAGEAGGITQHIGAYQVTVPSGGKITFIDTPGHAAFSEMRARGANVTDIVVLVVAADDGIMPQTIEAIKHAKAAGVPLMVAINKCDLPGANPQRVRADLLQHEVVVEEMGGDVLNVEVAAKTRYNIDKLLETILLQAEVMDLKANPNRDAVGTVIESRMEKGRGSVATVLVQKGTLHQGDIFVSGAEWGRVRALMNDRGETIKAADPAMPVEILGLQGTPQAGDDFVVVESEARAREVAEYRARKRREAQSAANITARGSLDQMFAQINKEGGEAVQELCLIIKGDVHGSVQAIASAVQGITGEGSEVRARVIQTGVGPITESDVMLANASKALIIGFNVRANPQARDLARRDNIDIRYYSIIYDVIDDVKKSLTSMLAPTLREKFIGYAQIRDVFNITKVGKVAGCMVTEGVVRRGAGVRLLRDDVVIHTGTLKTLKRFKDEVKEVKESTECGMAFENYDDIRVGDVIECFEIEKIARELQTA